MKPLGWRMRANEYYSYGQDRVIIKARHRRWETAEISAALFDLIEDRLYADDCHGCGAPVVYCYCAVLESYARFGDCWCDACVSFDAPPIPRVTLLDAYMAKRK